MRNNLALDGNYLGFSTRLHGGGRDKRDDNILGRNLGSWHSIEATSAVVAHERCISRETRITLDGEVSS